MSDLRYGKFEKESVVEGVIAGLENLQEKCEDALSRADQAQTQEFPT